MPKTITQKAKTNKLSERQQRIFDFLNNNPVAVASTTNNQGKAHGAVIYFSLNPDFVISFLTKADSYKHHNLLQNKHIALTVFDPHEQITCQIYGKAKLLVKPSIIDQIAKNIFNLKIKNKKIGEPPMSKLHLGSYVAVQVIPDNIKLAVYARPKAANNDEIFESLSWYELKSS